MTAAFAFLGLAAIDHNREIVHASDNNFTDGITVDSKGDGADANTADSICDDGAGNCTLRAAIEESNQETGTQTIRFNITGASDFTNGGQNGYTIQPNSALPFVTDTVIIDGYSQPGSLANSAIAPNPFNGRLLIELDGINAGVNQSGIVIDGAADVRIQGLIVNNWTNAGVIIGGDNAKVYGNYIGTDYSGSVAKPNMGNGVDGWLSIGNNALIGGLDASERNLISGNSGAAMGIGYDHNNWQLLGNYIGVAADGVTALPNAQPGGSGNPSIDFVSGTVVGGTAPGSTNVISGNLGHGIAPHDSPNTQIIGNLIGTDYTGTVPLGNGVAGITISGNSSNSVISKNVIADSGIDDIFIQDIQNVLIAGNAIGTDITGTIDMGSGQGEISSDNSTGIIGGTAADDANIIRYGASGGISLYNGSNISILRNNIYSNSGLGIDLDFSGAAINDPNDSDSGSNDLLNYPEYIHIAESGGDTTIAYRLNVPTGDYRIEFFSNTAADPSGFGEGETYLGYVDITHPGGGTVNFSHTLTGITGITNLSMTTTERNVATPSGFGATSEFSNVNGVVPISDLSIVKTLVNPEDVAIGATLKYQFNITNNGPDAVDLASFPGTNMGVNNLVVDIMAPDITYAGNVNNPNISCLSAGAGSAVMFGPAMANHSDHELVFCHWSGPSHLLANGASFSFTLDVSVQPFSDLIFDNYSIIPLSTTGDPDGFTMGQIFSSGNDVIDGFRQNNSINNFSLAAYPLPKVPSSSVSGSAQSLLSNTGQGLYIIISVVAIILVSLFGFVRKSSVHSR